MIVARALSFLPLEGALGVVRVSKVWREAVADVRFEVVAVSQPSESYRQLKTEVLERALQTHGASLKSMVVLDRQATLKMPDAVRRGRGRGRGRGS